MIERYEDPIIADIFSEKQRIRRWRDHTQNFVQRRVDAGAVLPDASVQVAAAKTPEPDEIRTREHVTGHDVAAFLQALDNAPSLGVQGRAALHYGLTSSDLVENAHHEALYLTTQVYLTRLGTLATSLSVLAATHRRTYMLGRTHGQAAEPTTWGHRLQVFASMVRRSQSQMRDARHRVMVRKTPGAIGTSPIYDGFPDTWQTPSTQVIPRDIQAFWAMACVQAVSVCEAIALEVRLLSRSEVGELREGGGARVGSSAMPHKRNPILAERICGLARVARAYLAPILETVPMHHDRDLANSSVERTAVPDLANLTGTLLADTTRLITGVEIDTARMIRNLDDAGYAPYSSLWVSMLQDRGVSYVQAHEAVTEAFTKADPLLFLLDSRWLDSEENLADWRKELEEKMTPAWMTRNAI